MNISKVIQKHNFKYITERTYPYLLRDLLIWIKDSSNFTDFTNLSWLLDEDRTAYSDAVYEYLIIAIAECDGFIEEDLYLPDGLREYYFEILFEVFEEFYYPFSEDIQNLLKENQIMHMNQIDERFISPANMKHSSLQEIW